MAFATIWLLTGVIYVGPDTSPNLKIARPVRIVQSSLEKGKQVFQNKSWTWQSAPDQYFAWRFLRLRHGYFTPLVFEAQNAGFTFAMTGGDIAPLIADGWKAVTNVSFAYNSTPAATAMQVVYRHVAPGEVVHVRQLNDSGTMILTRRLSWEDDAKDHFDVPGTPVHYSPSYTTKYVGDPSLARLPSGRLVATHSYFGETQPNNVVRVYQSDDGGQTWTHVRELTGQFWSGLFTVGDTLYLMGTSGGPDYKLIIRRSNDGGVTWTTPASASSGLIDPARHHTAPVPVLLHEGRYWRAVEKIGGTWSAYALSAPAGADFLVRTNWTATAALAWTNSAIADRWSEGNMVVKPDGELGIVLRLDPIANKAALVHIDPAGNLSFNADKDLIDFPGGQAKFTIRYDAQTSNYWSLVNFLDMDDPDDLDDPGISYQRTCIALTKSPDLRNWSVHTIVFDVSNGRLLEGTDNKLGMQYIDWLFDGDDIIAAMRTAWGQDVPRSHDANYLTFFRIEAFRSITAPSISPY